MIKQLKVKLENTPGTLQRCVALLSDSGVDIKALEVTERGDGENGVVHIIASNLDLAIGALRRADYAFEVEDVLGVEMDDEVGGLAVILGVLAEHQINIRYLYAFVSRVSGKSLAVFSIPEVPVAQKALEKAGVKIATQNRLAEDTNVRPFRVNLEDHFGKDFIW